MPSYAKLLPLIAILPSALGCLHFNATLSPSNSLTAHVWDDANNNNQRQPEDITCDASNVAPTTGNSNQWSIPCSRPDVVLDLFLDQNTNRFLDVIYKYDNPNAQGLQEQSSESPAEFYFNFRVGSLDGKFFKGREMCAQQDILNLVKPESLKNPCDGLDSC